MFTLNDWLAATEEQRAVMLDQLEERLGHELLLSRAFGSESALPWVVDRASSLEFVLVPPGDSTFGVGDLDEPAPLRFFDEGWRLQYEAYELERLSVWRAPRRQRASWPALLVSVRRWPMAYAPFVELRGVAARDPTATEWLALTAAGSTTGSALAHPFGFEDWGTAPERCGDAHAWLFDPYDPVSGDPMPSTWAQRAARAVVGHADEVELHVRPVVDLAWT